MIIFQVGLDKKCGGNHMLRKQFEEELESLHEEFYEMGLRVGEAVAKATEAFVNHDKELANTVILEDARINQCEVNLEKKSYEMLALQQPVTKNLRILVTILKASSDLERIGDHAVSIAKATIRVKGKQRVPYIEQEISEMSKATLRMVDAVLHAYIKTNTKKAKEIAKEDDQINAYFKKIYQNTLKEMHENPETIIGGADYLQVAGYLERIGDYVTNVCEWIVYLETGKISELG